MPYPDDYYQEKVEKEAEHRCQILEAKINLLANNLENLTNMVLGLKSDVRTSVLHSQSPADE